MSRRERPDRRWQERHHVRPRVVHLAFAAFVVLIASGGVATWILGSGATWIVGARAEDARHETMPAEIDTVDQTLFATRPPSRSPLAREPDGASAGAGAGTSGYEWADQDRGLVRLPLDRAMDVIAGRGRHVK